MSDEREYTGASQDVEDSAPGDEPAAAGDLGKAVRGYLLGLVLAVALTAASFCTVSTHLIYAPGVPVAVLVLAIAQMGIHLAFFLHITTSPDNTNNVLALAFGVLICCLVVFGSLWIMANLDHNMMPMSEMLKMQR
jgi:cytochrome o ubiquinol oxidase operon protein cyoD